MSFEFDFRADQVQQLLHGNPHSEAWHGALVDELPKYQIVTVNRVAMFIAQCGHESANFTALTENLNYKPQALMAIWKKRFPTMEIANQYAHNPEKIANRAYCDRMGNGPEESGDGWTFHGRGLIQLTGRSLYEAFAREIGKGLEETVNYCETPDGAVESACFFWEHHQLNVHSDAGDIERVTKIINGGTLGIEDRTQRYNHAIQIFQG
jgi:putative chitinase